jgi:hypothetical protein
MTPWADFVDSGVNIDCSMVIIQSQIAIWASTIQAIIIGHACEIGLPFTLGG